MKILPAIAISLSMVAAGARAQTSDGSKTIEIIRKGSMPSREGLAENFTGSVRIDPLFPANAPARGSGSIVTFEPGARTAWHTHPLGQTLVVTAGIGRVQRWGDPVDEIRQGDVVWIPPGQKHWHGAAPDNSMAHIGITEQLDGKAVEWMEKVTDAQYGAPLRARGESAKPGTQGRSSQMRTGQRGKRDPVARAVFQKK